MTPKTRRANPETDCWRLNKTRVVWLTLSQVLVVAPHATRLPVWISVLFALMSFCTLMKPLDRALPRWTLTVLGLAVGPAIFVSYGTLFGREAGVAMLVALGGMKLLEARTLRDAYVLTCLSFFLLITIFLFSQTMGAAAYVLSTTVVVLATLHAIHAQEHRQSAGVQLKAAAVITAQALPIAIAMFVLFPRSGPLWGLPKDAHGQAVSGLSGSMSPGSISSLGLSDEVAFRALFHGAVPPAQALYWRGPVLWETDGRSWYAGTAGAASTPLPKPQTALATLAYTVTLEPHQQRWLLALDRPISLPPNAYMSKDFQVISKEKVQQRKRYRVRSQPDYRITELDNRQRHRALALPANHHPRARALAERFTSEADGPLQVVDRALRFFRDEAFYYTLEPGQLSGDPIDQFLFDSRRGFCEHYATAFTVIMRAAGIPARIVTGYQGGELNTLGRYIIVRDRDAHAWTEVWIAERGWVRIDPTAAVSPGRIELGMQGALPEAIGATTRVLSPHGAVGRALQSVRHGLDALNHGWNLWVLEYRTTRQRALLARLGLDPERLWQAALVLCALVVTLLSGLAVLSARRKAPKDPVRRGYQRFVRKLAKRGIASPSPDEGPVDFATRVATTHPELADAVRAITSLYIDVRYASETQHMRAFNQAVADFRP